MIDFIKQLLKYKYWLIPMALSGIIFGMIDMPLSSHNPILCDLIMWLFICIIIITIFTFIQALKKLLS